MIRMDQPGSDPLHPDSIPNPATQPAHVPNPAPVRPVRVPDTAPQKAHHGPGKSPGPILLTGRNPYDIVAVG